MLGFSHNEFLILSRIILLKDIILNPSWSITSSFQFHAHWQCDRLFISIIIIHIYIYICPFFLKTRMQKEYNRSIAFLFFLLIQYIMRRDDKISIAFDFSCIIMMLNMFKIPFDIFRYHSDIFFFAKRRKKASRVSIDKNHKVM